MAWNIETNERLTESLYSEIEDIKDTVRYGLQDAVYRYIESEVENRLSDWQTDNKVTGIDFQELVVDVTDTVMDSVFEEKNDGLEYSLVRKHVLSLETYDDEDGIQESNASDDYVQRKVRIIKDEHPEWAMDMVLAVAYSYARKKGYKV